MHMRRVRMPTTGLESWTILDPSGTVEPVERWLAYLASVEKSPNSSPGRSGNTAPQRSTPTATPARH
jgi:hypothetical protein